MNETEAPGNAKILALPGADEERVVDDGEPVTRVGEWSMRCSHTKVEVREDEREVRCRDCNALVDPYEYLSGWARRRQHEIARLRRLEEEQAAFKTHLLGRDALTLCGLGPTMRGMAGRPWTLRLTNDRYRANCHRCVDRLGKGPVEVPLYEADASAAEKGDS